MKIELLFEKDNREILEVRVYRAKDHIVDVRKLVNQADNWLIEKRHRWQQIQLVMTGVAPYLVLGFDEKGKLINRLKNTGKHDAPFSSLQTSDWILLLPVEGTSLIDIMRMRFCEDARM
jgi:hypothetical protein